MKKIGDKKREPLAHLPVHNKITLVYITSIVSIVLIGIVTISAVLNSDHFYPNEALVETFLPNDIVYLAIGIPMILLSMIFTWRSKRIGVLFWGGAILFSLYNSIAYIVALPFQWGFFIHLLLVILNSYSLLFLYLSIDGEALASVLQGKVYEKLCGGVLAGFGILFFLRAFFVLLGAIISGTILSGTEIAPNVSDAVIGPAFVIIGISLWRKKSWGYIGALGFLFLASMLFVALLVFFILQPILTNASFSPVDFIVIFAMGLICFVPFGLFFRGVGKSG